jgi:hypothetical protein
MVDTMWGNAGPHPSVSVSHRSFVTPTVLVVALSFLVTAIALFAASSALASDLTEADFSGLQYTDREKDDYHLEMKGEGWEFKDVKSSGEKGKRSDIDVVALEATFDQATDMATFNLRVKGECDVCEESVYYFFVVNGDHKQSGPLLEPWEHEEGTFAWTFADMDNVICYFGMVYTMSGAQAASEPTLFDLDGEVGSDSITMTVSGDDLERVGATTGSGFRVYAYAHYWTTSSDLDSTEHDIYWDSIGYGAASPPKEYGWSESSSLMLILVLIIIIVVVAVGGGLAVRRRRRKKLTTTVAQEAIAAAQAGTYQTTASVVPPAAPPSAPPTEPPQRPPGTP